MVIDGGLPLDAEPLILQFREGATEPSFSGMERLMEGLMKAFPGRRVVLLPCGIEVAPGSQEDIQEIGEKLDALIAAIASEGEEEQDAPDTSLDGAPMPGERNQAQSLG